MVAVIIPCFNVEEYIKDCLDSVRCQGPVVSEVYVVDNGSRDNTVARIHEWKAMYPEFPLKLLHEPRKGAPFARNAPLDSISCEWIQFLDADDVLLPGKIDQQTYAVDVTADAIVDTYVMLSADATQIHKVPVEDSIEVGLMRSSLGITSSNLWRTSMIRRVGGWNEAKSSSQEYDLMLRIHLAGGRFMFMDTTRTLIRGRVHGQISTSNPELRWQSFVETRLRLLDSMDLEEYDEEFRAMLLDALFFGLRMLFKYDPNRAIALYAERLQSRGFRPNASLHTSRSYIAMHRFFGFERTELIRRIFRKQGD